MTTPMPPPAPGAPPTASAYGRNLITEAVRIRRETDDVMSALWLLSPLAGIVALIGLTISGTLIANALGLGAGAGFLVGIVSGFIVDIILYVLPWYKMIKRRSEHFRRDRILREGLINYIRGVSAERGIEAQMNTEIATMTTVHSEANGEETEKSAILWIILSIIFFPISWYVWYFLTKDPHKHDVRQLAFMQQVQSSFSKLQKTVVFPFWKSLPDRSFFLYLVLTFITLGFFGLYWNYVLITDFNQHFRAQWQIEDQLVANL